MRYILLSLLIVACATPLYAEAYVTTGSAAKRVTETTALYYIDFAFGHKTKDLYLPVQAVRSSTAAAADALSFQLFEDGEDMVTNDSARGMVISDTELRGTYYHIPAG